MSRTTASQLLCAAGLVTTISFPAHAQDIRCNLVSFGKAVDHQSEFFAGSLGDGVNTSASLTLGCFGDLNPFSFDIAAHAESGNDPELRVRELKFSTDIGENLFFLFGYHPQNTDPSFAIQPIGLLGDSGDYARFTDRTYERQSSVMARLEYHADSFVLASTLAENRRYGLDSLQWINSLAFSSGETDAQAIVRYDDQMGLGVGFGFSSIIGNNLELHGSVFAQQGSSRLYHADALSGTRQFRLSNNSPIGRHRLNSETIVPRVVIGGHYTFNNGDNLLLEFVYDGEGLTSTEWQNYIDIVNFHQNTPVPIAARDGNLGFDLDALGNANMQNYLFGRYTITRTAVDWSFSTLLNLHDQSARLGIDAIYSLQDNMDIYGELSVTSGCGRCEFRVTPGARSVNIGLSYKF